MTETGHWNKQKCSQMYYYLFCARALNIVILCHTFMDEKVKQPQCYEIALQANLKVDMCFCPRVNFTTSREDDWQSCLNTHISLPGKQECLSRTWHFAYTCPAILEAYFVVLFLCLHFFFFLFLLNYGNKTAIPSGKSVVRRSTNVWCFSNPRH